MKKKRILLGSILAVAILIFLSFTNVVGYRTDNSNSVDISPLFDTRTNRAIEQDKSLYSNDYIGKGEEIKIYFPKKDNEKELLCKYIELINQMDKKAFNNLKTVVVSQVNKDEELREIGIHNVLLAINLMRIYPDEVKKQILNEGENAPREYTRYYSFCEWFPGCFLLQTISVIIGITLQILLQILYKIDGYISRNYPTQCQGTCLAFTCDQGYTFCQEKCLNDIRGGI
jgi:hypothetical protein